MALSRSENAATWTGWSAALRKELRSAGGEMPWYSLRDALVAHYYAAAPLGKADRNDDRVGCCALANVPAAYLSREDAMVRLPVEDVGDSTPSKKRRREAEVLEHGNRESLNENVQNTRIHVSQIPFSADEAAISKFFSGCGQISQCELLYTHDGKSRGIAFITFASRSALSAAVALSESDFGGRPVKVSEATGVGRRESKGKGKGKDKGKGKSKGSDGKNKQPETREFEVFVGGLPFGVSVETIQHDFAECGEFGRCNIPVDAAGEHTGIAFINYLTRAGMEKALEYNAQEYGGVWIRVQKADAPRSQGRITEESYGDSEI